MTDVDVHDDVPTGVASTLLARNAGNTAYVTRTFETTAFTGLAANDYARYDGTDWENRTIAEVQADILGTDLVALEALSSTGLAARTGSGTWAERTITGSSSVSVADGDGVSGNPTLTVLPAGVDHDSTLNYVAGQHLTPGVGFTTSGSTIVHSIADLTNQASIAAADSLIMHDTVAGAREITFANFEGDIDHANILNIGTSSHATIDTHIAATAAHGTTGAVVGTTDSQTLTNKTIALGSNTVSGTAAEFNTAVTDDTLALVSDDLSVFAATTSAELRGVISDETGGTGLLVFNNAPVLIGAAWTGNESRSGTAHQFDLNAGTDGIYSIVNGGAGDCNLLVDGHIALQSGTGFSTQLQAGSASAARTWTFTNTSDTFVGESRDLTTAANGALSGGGDLSANRTMRVSIEADTTSEATPGSTDWLLWEDTTANTLHRVQLTNLPAGAGSTLDGAYDEGGDGAGRTVDADTGPVVLRDLGVLDSNTGTALLNCNHDATEALGAGWTGQGVQFRTDRTQNTAATTNDDYDNALIQRTAGASHASAVLNSAGALLKLENIEGSTTGTVADSAILIEGSCIAAADPALRFYVAAETTARWACDVDGLMVWGPGASGATDTTLERTAAGVLDLANILDVNTGLRVAGAAAIGSLLIGDGTNFIPRASGTAGQHLRVGSAGTDLEYVTEEKSKSITIDTPVDGDLFAIWITNKDITVTEIQGICEGGTSVVIDLEFAATVITGGTQIETITPTTTLTSDVSMGGDATVPADNVILVDIGTVTGSVNSVTLTVNYTED